MLQKETYLNGGGGVIVDPYEQFTHIVNVADLSEISNRYGYSTTSTTKPHGGSISPDTLNGSTITDLYTDPILSTTTFKVDRPITINEVLFFGRKDKKQYREYTHTADNEDASVDEYLIFTADDAGKDIPIYLATTPPPLRLGVGPRFSLNSANRRLYREVA